MINMTAMIDIVAIDRSIQEMTDIVWRMHRVNEKMTEMTSTWDH